MTQFISKVKNIDDGSHIKHIFTNLNDIRQRTCLSLSDEVYVNATLQNHGGIVFGKSVNKSHLLANTILAFKIVTLFGGPKVIYKMFTVQERNLKFIFEQTNLILNAIKNAGGNHVGFFL